MATFKRFEDIQAWQLGRELNREIYRLTSEGAFVRDFELRDQIRRAAARATSTIAERYGRRDARDFPRFLDIASGWVAEVPSTLYLGLDLSYLNEDVFEATMARTRRIAGALVARTRYLRDAPAICEPDAPYAPGLPDDDP